MQDNGFYDMETFKNHSDLFKIYVENKNFVNHGDSEKWFEIIKNLPNLHTDYLEVSDSQIVIGDPKEINVEIKKSLEIHMMQLSPWRKGPFNLFGVEIDSEWRSDKKWKRIKDYLPSNRSMRIGDIGCSNGYYSYKLLNLNPELIVGMDKTALFIWQFIALKNYAKKIQNLIILPCSAEEFSQKKLDFEFLLSMGVLYHVKNPKDHIKILKNLLKKNGFLLIETLTSLDKNDISIQKGKKYAGMKNVNKIFTKNNLINILNSSGFKNIECVDESITDFEEQRTTKWMKGKSLKDFMCINGNTIEGYPPLCRSIFIAQKK